MPQPSIVHSKFMSRVALLTVIAFYCSGCMTGSIVFNYGRIKEKLEAQRILCNKDGIIAIEVKSSCYRTRIFGDTDEPLPQYQSQNCYLIIDSSHIRDTIKTTSATTDSVYQITYLHVPYHSISIIPENFTPIATTPGQSPLPPALADTAQYKMCDPVPYKYNGREVYVGFKAVKLESERSKLRGWIYPLIPPLLASDLVITAGAAVISLPLAAAGTVLFVPCMIIQSMIQH